MAQFVISPNKKITPFLNVVGIMDVQQQMMGASFEDYCRNEHGSYDVVGNGYKYIHYNLTDVVSYMIISPIIESNFVITFSF